MSKGIVNIEIRDYVIRYTETNPKDSSKIDRLGEFFLPEGVIEGGMIEQPDTFQKLLHTVTKKWKLKRKKVRLTMPDSLVIIRKQKIPGKVQQEDIQRYVKFQLGDTIHLPFPKPLFETVLLNQGKDNHEISIISTCEELVNPFIKHFEKEKMKVIAVDISPLNYYRMFYQQGKIDDQDHTLLIQYNAKNVVFSAFENHTPIFLQQFQLTLPEGDRHTFGPMMTKDDFNREDVLLEFEEIRTEIERVERFYQYSMNNGEKSFTKTIVVGDHPYLTDINERLSDRSETEIVSLTDDAIDGPKGLKLERKFHNVYGLAMKDGH